MKSTVEEMEDNRVRVSVEVEEAELDPAISEAFKLIAKQVRIPGFRKGKVPRKVLESHIGKGAARGEALETAIPEFFLEAIGEHQVDIIAAPDYDVTAGAEDGDLAFDAVVQVRPQINIGGYDALQVEISRPTPTDEEIDEQIDLIRGQFSELQSVERAVETGDRVTVDIAGSHEGEAVEGLTATDYVYEVGSGAVVPEIDENLEGAEVGATLEFTSEHPDPEVDGELAFVVDVKEVQENVLPELTDEFVQEATEFQTVEEFRQDTVDRLTKQKTALANNELRENTAKALSQLVEEDPPEPLVDGEVNERIQEMAWRMQQQGIEFGQYLQLTGGSVEDLAAQMREPAVESAKVDLALRAVAHAEGLEPTDEDMEAEFAEAAANTGQDIEIIRAQVKDGNQMLQIRSDMGKRKAVDWVLERVTIVDAEGVPVDRELLEMPEEDHDHDHADHDHDHADHDHDHDHADHDHADEEE